MKFLSLYTVGMKWFYISVCYFIGKMKTYLKDLNNSKYKRMIKCGLDETLI